MSTTREQSATPRGPRIARGGRVGVPSVTPQGRDADAMANLERLNGVA